MQDLAPITLYTDWGLEGGVSNVWRNVQGSGGRGSDLMPPMQCREVRLCFRLSLYRRHIAYWCGWPTAIAMGVAISHKCLSDVHVSYQMLTDTI